MEEAAAEFGAFSEATVFLDHFKDLPDPRQRGKVVYPLVEVLLLCLLAVLGGAETFVDIARFGEKKLGLLRRFRPFRDGTPSHDHLGDIFATLDAGKFQRCFVSWVADLTGTSADVIAIDGKTLRRSYQKKGAKAPIHMVSAFAARSRSMLASLTPCGVMGCLPGRSQALLLAHAQRPSCTGCIGTTRNPRAAYWRARTLRDLFRVVILPKPIPRNPFVIEISLRRKRHMGRGFRRLSFVA
jgi:hypothetical protein